MVDIKNDLASKGYRNAKLVKDFPDNPAFHDDKTVHIIEKSQYYIKYWADALVFVFFKNASNEGVSIEFEFCCMKVNEKLSYSIVFSEYELHLSSLILGSVRLHEIRSETFSNQQELCDKASGYLTNFIHRLYWYI